MKKLKERSAFLIFSIVFILLMLVNCLMTGSPYSALHSGKIGIYASSITFAINPTYLILFSLVVAFLVNINKGIKFSKKNTAIWLIPVILFSGLINSQLWENLNIYIYDSLSILLLSLVASQDANVQSADNALYDDDFHFMSKLMMALMAIGLIAVFLAKGRFGILYFEFSRQSRGEVTIWVLFNASVFLVIGSCVNDLLKNRSIPLLIFACISAVITLSTSSRTQALIYVICILITWLKQDFNTKKFFGFFVILFIILFGFQMLSDFFLLGQSTISINTISTIMNGRFELWEYYWNLFKIHPFVGYGPVTISTETARILGASSEIGILKNVTIYGIAYLIVEVYILIQAIKNSLLILKTKEQYQFFDYMIVFLFWSSFPLILQQHARILNYSDFLFWYSMLYLCYRNPHSGLRISESKQVKMTDK